MIDLTKKAKDEWRKRIGDEIGKNVFALAREHRPKIDVSHEVQPHHIQLMAGRGDGWDSCLDFLESIARDDKPKSIEDGTPAIVNTRLQP